MVIENFDYQQQKQLQEGLNWTRKFGKEKKSWPNSCIIGLSISGGFIILCIWTDVESRWTLFPVRSCPWKALSSRLELLGFWWQLTGKLTWWKYIWKGVVKSGFASRTSANNLSMVLLKLFNSRRSMSLSSCVSVLVFFRDWISLDSLEHLNIFKVLLLWKCNTFFQKPAQFKVCGFNHTTLPL